MQRARYMSWLGIAAVFIMGGCASSIPHKSIPTNVTSSPPTTIGDVQRTWYGEKARVAVMEFDNKTGVDFQVSHSMKGTTVGNPVGQGMKEQLVTALMQTGAFIVLERQALEDVMREQDIGASGRIKRETAAAIGEIEGAEFLIYGAVTEYTPSQASLSAGVGVDPLFGAMGAGPGASLFGILAKRAAVAAFANQDHVAIDIRLVDAKTGRVVNATSVEGSPQDLGGSLGGIFGSVLLGVSMQSQTPMQKAVRACIIKAVNWIADNCLATREKNIQLVATPPPPSVTVRSRVDANLKKIQRGLNTLGYDCGRVDGKRGAKTNACISRFLEDTGVEETALEEELEKRLSQKPREHKEPPAKVLVTPVATNPSTPSPAAPTSTSGVDEWGQ